MKLRRFTRKATVAALFTGVLMAASVALAAWVATGTGSGAAKATNASDLVVTATVPAAQLYPGKTAANLYVNINNPNPYPVTVTSIVRTAAPITAAGGIGTCTTTGVSMTDQTGLTINIAAGGDYTGPLAGAVSMDNTSDTGCQGATFTIPVTASGQSNA